MTQPTLNGQVLGQAENATRAVLNRLLDGQGATFHQWVGLNLVEAAGGAVSRDLFVQRMVDGLKVDDWEATETISSLRAGGLLAGDTDLALTDPGRARYTRLRVAINGVTKRLYAGLPADDLATAGRVLTIVTERANAELAA